MISRQNFQKMHSMPRVYVDLQYIWTSTITDDEKNIFFSPTKQRYAVVPQNTCSSMCNQLVNLQGKRRQKRRNTRAVLIEARTTRLINAIICALICCCKRHINTEDGRILWRCCSSVQIRQRRCIYLPPYRGTALQAFFCSSYVSWVLVSPTHTHLVYTPTCLN